MTVGLDHYRAAMLLALVEKKAGYSFSGEDVYLNVAGGMSLEEPAADLGVVLAVVSSLKNKAIPKGMAVFGEIGLSGEIRSVGQPLARIKEAHSLGFETVILPAGNLSQLDRNDLPPLDCLGAQSVRQALQYVF